MILFASWRSIQTGGPSCGGYFFSQNLLDLLRIVQELAAAQHRRRSYCTANRAHGAGFYRGRHRTP